MKNSVFDKQFETSLNKQMAEHAKALINGLPNENSLINNYLRNFFNNRLPFYQLLKNSANIASNKPLDSLMFFCKMTPIIDIDSTDSPSKQFSQFTYLSILEGSINWSNKNFRITINLFSEALSATFLELCLKDKKDLPNSHYISLLNFLLDKIVSSYKSPYRYIAGSIWATSIYQICKHLQYSIYSCVIAQLEPLPQDNAALIFQFFSKMTFNGNNLHDKKPLYQSLFKTILKAPPTDVIHETSINFFTNLFIEYTKADSKFSSTGLYYDLYDFVNSHANSKEYYPFAHEARALLIVFSTHKKINNSSSDIPNYIKKTISKEIANPKYTGHCLKELVIFLRGKFYKPVYDSYEKYTCSSSLDYDTNDKTFSLVLQNPDNVSNYPDELAEYLVQFAFSNIQYFVEKGCQTIIQNKEFFNKNLTSLFRAAHIILHPKLLSPEKHSLIVGVFRDLIFNFLSKMNIPPRNQTDSFIYSISSFLESLSFHQYQFEDALTLNFKDINPKQVFIPVPKLTTNIYAKWNKFISNSLETSIFRSFDESFKEFTQIGTTDDHILSNIISLFPLIDPSEDTPARIIHFLFHNSVLVSATIISVAQSLCLIYNGRLRKSLFDALKSIIQTDGLLSKERFYISLLALRSFIECLDITSLISNISCSLIDSTKGNELDISEYKNYFDFILLICLIGLFYPNYVIRNYSLDMLRYISVIFRSFGYTDERNNSDNDTDKSYHLLLALLNIIDNKNSEMGVNVFESIITMISTSGINHFDTQTIKFTDIINSPDEYVFSFYVAEFSKQCRNQLSESLKNLLFDFLGKMLSLKKDESDNINIQIFHFNLFDDFFPPAAIDGFSEGFKAFEHNCALLSQITPGIVIHIINHNYTKYISAVLYYIRKQIVLFQSMEFTETTIVNSLISYLTSVLSLPATQKTLSDPTIFANNNKVQYMSSDKRNLLFYKEFLWFVPQFFKSVIDSRGLVYPGPFPRSKGFLSFEWCEDPKIQKLWYSFIMKFPLNQDLVSVLIYIIRLFGIPDDLYTEFVKQYLDPILNDIYYKTTSAYYAISNSSFPNTSNVFNSSNSRNSRSNSIGKTSLFSVNLKELLESCDVLSGYLEHFYSLQLSTFINRAYRLEYLYPLASLFANDIENWKMSVQLPDKTDFTSFIYSKAGSLIAIGLFNIGRKFSQEIPIQIIEQYRDAGLKLIIGASYGCFALKNNGKACGRLSTIISKVKVNIQFQLGSICFDQALILSTELAKEFRFLSEQFVQKILQLSEYDPKMPLLAIPWFDTTTINPDIPGVFPETEPRFVSFTTFSFIQTLMKLQSSEESLALIGHACQNLGILKFIIYDVVSNPPAIKNDESGKEDSYKQTAYLKKSKNIILYLFNQNPKAVLHHLILFLSYSSWHFHQIQDNRIQKKNDLSKFLSIFTKQPQVLKRKFHRNHDSSNKSITVPTTQKSSNKSNQESNQSNQTSNQPNQTSNQPNQTSNQPNQTSNQTSNQSTQPSNQSNQTSNQVTNQAINQLSNSIINKLTSQASNQSINLKTTSLLTSKDDVLKTTKATLNEDDDFKYRTIISLILSCLIDCAKDNINAFTNEDKGLLGLYAFLTMEQFNNEYIAISNLITPFIQNQTYLQQWGSRLLHCESSTLQKVLTQSLIWGVCCDNLEFAIRGLGFFLEMGILEFATYKEVNALAQSNYLMMNLLYEKSHHLANKENERLQEVLNDEGSGEIPWEVIHLYLILSFKAIRLILTKKSKEIEQQINENSYYQQSAVNLFYQMSSILGARKDTYISMITGALGVITALLYIPTVLELIANDISKNYLNLENDHNSEEQESTQNKNSDNYVFKGVLENLAKESQGFQIKTVKYLLEFLNVVGTEKYAFIGSTKNNGKIVLILKEVFFKYHSFDAYSIRSLYFSNTKEDGFNSRSASGFISLLAHSTSLLARSNNTNINIEDIIDTLNSHNYCSENNNSNNNNSNSTNSDSNNSINNNSNTGNSNTNDSILSMIDDVNQNEEIAIILNILIESALAVSEKRSIEVEGIYDFCSELILRRKGNIDLKISKLISKKIKNEMLSNSFTKLLTVMNGFNPQITSPPVIHKKAVPEFSKPFNRSLKTDLNLNDMGYFDDIEKIPPHVISASNFFNCHQNIITNDIVQKIKAKPFSDDLQLLFKCQNISISENEQLTVTEKVTSNFFNDYQAYFLNNLDSASFKISRNDNKRKGQTKTDTSNIVPSTLFLPSFDDINEIYL